MFGVRGRRPIGEEKKKLKSAEHWENADFAAEWRDRRRALHLKETESAPPTGPKKRRTNRPAGAGLPLPPPDALLLLSGSDARAYMPPDGKLWRSYRDCAWHCRVAELPSHSRSVLTHREDALRQILKFAWQDHLCLHGLAEADCPIVGLF